MELSPVIAFIRKYQRFILTAHESPDGDAIGSEVAFHAALMKAGKEVHIINSDIAPYKFTFVDRENAIQTLDDEGNPPEDLPFEDYALIILDTNDLGNIGKMSSTILPRVRDYFIIDHHEDDGSVSKGKLIEASASSTCELLYDLIARLDVELDMTMAESMYMGIMYDTGSFVYPKTTAKTFEIAHRLVSMGVVPNAIYEQLYESNTIESLILQTKVMSTLEFAYGRHVSILTMLWSTIQDSGANFEDGYHIINIPLNSEQVRVSIFFKQNEEGILRCSIRSKGDINVASIAQDYGGGGHKTAAGFKCREPLEIVKQKVLDKLQKYFLE